MTKAKPASKLKAMKAKIASKLPYEANWICSVLVIVALLVLAGFCLSRTVTAPALESPEIVTETLTGE
jgi:hypothetical protein